MDEVASLVRRVDRDRWLAAQFAPREVRQALTTLYALNYEIARTAEIVREPGLGHIRHAWWREALEEVVAGKPARAHPALVEFATCRQKTSLSPELLIQIVEARAKDFDEHPFSSWADLEAYVDATAGNLMRLSLQACQARADDRVLTLAARAWGTAGIARAAEYWAARGRSLVPAGASVDALRDRAVTTYREVHGIKVSVEAFPALGYVVLTPQRVDGRPSALSDQLALVWAAFRGRL